MFVSLKASRDLIPAQMAVSCADGTFRYCCCHVRVDHPKKTAPLVTGSLEMDPSRMFAGSGISLWIGNILAGIGRERLSGPPENRE